jgi:signal transduction histidine kinase
VQLASVKRMKKRARQILEDLRRINHLLRPAEVREILDGNEQIISLLNEMLQGSGNDFEKPGSGKRSLGGRNLKL